MNYTTHCFKSWYVSTRLNTADLRRFLLENLAISTLINTMIETVPLATAEKSDAERNAAIAGVILLWTTIPFALWGILRENRGMLAVYVLYGLLAGVGKVMLTVVATVMVAASCQVGQSFFQGCSLAVDELPCLANSTCSRDMINAYNDVANVMCEAWSTDDCSDAHTARTSMGFTMFYVIMVILQIFGTIIPVYFGFMYYTRLEIVEPVVSLAGYIHPHVALNGDLLDEEE
eukprot:TRINITY_DN73_c0_g1_i6.p1 TRINITY_DN73_c0_g1~~TRINITY_DN73_c0_g1_i6.p1  ORF type:complete len:232 (+),score=34.93 TRINITY_DN73_c0_g1_i6:40-735(+)